MKNSILQTSNTFDTNKAMKAFIIQLVYMESQVYRFLWCFAFKKRYRFLGNRLNDQYQSLTRDLRFYLNTGDEWVIHGVYFRNVLSAFRMDFEANNDINIWDVINDPELIEESQRYQPLSQMNLKGKTYHALKADYLQSISSYVNYLYTMSEVFAKKNYEAGRGLFQNFDVQDDDRIFEIEMDNETGILFYSFIQSLMHYVSTLREMNNRNQRS